MSKKGAGRSAPALPPGKGRASPGRGSPGRGGRGGGASPGRGAPPPPAEAPLAEISPPTEKDIERKKLRDIMDRKVLVWDRMMGTDKEEDRRLGLETFKRLSEDEIALATKNLSKDKLKEFIDLKIHYFDQLANARNHDKRVEGLRRFKKVGDDEYNLAKVMGPGDSLEDMVKMRDELDKKEQAKKAEEKKKKELLDKMKKQEMEQRLPKVSVSMTDPNMTSQMLAKQQLMHLADIEKAATENVAQVAYGLSPHEVIAQQQHLLAAAAQMPAMMAPLPPMSPMVPMSPLPPMTPPMSPMPPMMPAAFYGPFPPDVPGSQTPGSAFGAVAMDLDNKMRLLSQLETTRRALQSQPVGSRSSMADEIKANLRKLNHLKMRLIDEILGEGAAPAGGYGEVRTIEHVRKRDGEKSKKDRKIILEFVGPGGKISDLDVGKELGKKDGDKKQTIVLEQEFAGAIQSPSLTNATTCPAHACPAYQQCLTYGCMTSAPVGSVSQTMCPNPQHTYSHPQLNYPCAPLDIKPEVIWERKETKTYADKSTLMDPPEALKYMDAAVMSDDQTVVKEEYKHYTCEEPVYENAVSPPPGYQLLKPNYVPVVPLAMLEQGLNYARARPQHEIGISAVPLEDDPEYPPAHLQRSCPPVVSKTTIVFNRAADEAAPASPVAAAPVQVAASPTPAQVALTPVIARLSRSSSSGRRGRRALHDSMERLARSIDDMYNTLSSPTRSRRRSRSFDDDDDDDDGSGGYMSRTTPRRRRRRRYSNRRRSKSRGFPDDWRDDDLDQDDDEMQETTFRTRRRRSRADQDELPSLWGWLCRSLCNLTEGYDERMRAEARDMRVLQMGNRIRNLIQNVIRVSREVIEARRAIQQSGLKGEDYTKNIFAAESKLWELIDLEAQLANELALYRQSDLATDDQYFQGLANAEDKIRRLIGVETQLAREIGNWRKSSGKKLPSPSKTTIYTALSRLPSVPSMLGRSSGSSSYLLSTSPSGTTSGAATTTATPSSSSGSPTATPTSVASGVAASTSGSPSSSAGSKKSAKSKGSSKKKKKKKSKGSSKKKKKKKSKNKKKKRSKKSSKKKKKRKRKRKSKSRSSKSKKRRKKRRRKKKKK